MSSSMACSTPITCESPMDALDGRSRSRSACGSESKHRSIAIEHRNRFGCGFANYRHMRFNLCVGATLSGDAQCSHMVQHGNFLPEAVYPSPGFIFGPIVSIVLSSLFYCALTGCKICRQFAGNVFILYEKCVNSMSGEGDLGSLRSLLCYRCESFSCGIQLQTSISMHKQRYFNTTQHSSLSL